tara:strand:- start:1018 stop:1437 length:420 start_codon:yes stop_codon:yes gene_type:complete
LGSGQTSEQENVMKGTLVFNISVDRTSEVSDDIVSPLSDAWEGFDIAPIKTHELDENCTHHFIIPTSGKSIVTGECKKCEGRKEFKNTFESVLKHHIPEIDRELDISGLQNITEPDLEKNYVQPLKDMLDFNSVSPSLS